MMTTFPMTMQISLLCPQPYFESLDVITSILAAIIPLWRFPFTIPPPLPAIHGETTETGSGEKSPDNPYTLTGKVAAVDLSGTSFTLPAPLYSLPNGVADEWDADTGKGIRRVGKMVLDGSQPIYGFNLSSGRAWASLTVAGVKPNTSSDSDSNFYCDKLTSRTPNQTWATVHSVSRDIAGKITVSIAPDGIATAGDLLNRLAANPVTVLYELAEPVVFAAEAPSGLNIGGMMFSRKSDSVIVDVPNASEADVGMTVVFFANSALTNPSIMNLNTGEALRLDTVMQAGDTITVTTHRGNKRITRTRGGVSDNLFNALSPGSVFLQLHQGNNPIRYNADTNLGGLELTIYHTDYYAGV